MPTKKKAANAAAAAGTSKISSYYSKTNYAAKKPSKRPRQDSDFEETPNVDSTASKQPRSGETVSPSQLQQAGENKAIAEAKLWARKFGAKELGATWMKLLVPEFKKDYLTKLMQMVDDERKKYTVYPPPGDVFSWTTACPLEEVKVVILGQDPYHGPGQAHGLCFSVRVGVPPPPSLNNMYKELVDSVPGFTVPNHGYLMGWARQGVLLLNACLTVKHKEPNSHAGKGWEILTDAVIHWINKNLRGVAFLLWGSYAQKKGAFIDKGKHHVLKSAHPSPLSASRGFFGCKHFSEVNQLLAAQGDQPIDWTQLPETLDS